MQIGHRWHCVPATWPAWITGISCVQSLPGGLSTCFAWGTSSPAGQSESSVPLLPAHLRSCSPPFCRHSRLFDFYFHWYTFVGRRCMDLTHHSFCIPTPSPSSSSSISWSSPLMQKIYLLLSVIDLLFCSFFLFWVGLDWMNFRRLPSYATVAMI